MEVTFEKYDARESISMTPIHQKPTHTNIKLIRQCDKRTKENAPRVTGKRSERKSFMQIDLMSKRHEMMIFGFEMTFE